MLIVVGAHDVTHFRFDDLLWLTIIERVALLVSIVRLNGAFLILNEVSQVLCATDLVFLLLVDLLQACPEVLV